ARGGGVQAAGRGAGQVQGVVDFTVGEQSGVTGDGRAMKLQLDFAVEIDAHGVVSAVTHWVPRSFRQEVVGNAGYSREKAQTPCRTDRGVGETGANGSRGRAGRLLFLARLSAPFASPEDRPAARLKRPPQRQRRRRFGQANPRRPGCGGGWSLLLEPLCARGE